MPDRHGGYSKHMLCFRCGPICSFQIFYVMRLVQFYNQWEMVLNYKPAFHSEKQEATSGWQQKGSHSKIWNKEPHVRGWLKTPRAACFLVNTWVQPHIFCTQEIIYKGLCVKLFHESENSHWMQRPMSFRAFSLIFTFKGLDLKENIFFPLWGICTSAKVQRECLGKKGFSKD